MSEFSRSDGLARAAGLAAATTLPGPAAASAGRAPTSFGAAAQVADDKPKPLMAVLARYRRGRGLTGWVPQPLPRSSAGARDDEESEA